MQDRVTFVLNGEKVSVRDVAPTMSVLNYLRKERRLCGTKEGCAEGDCGACTVVVGELDVDGRRVIYRAVNACIMLLPMLHGKALVSVEALRQPEPAHGAREQAVKPRAGQAPPLQTRLHPVQQALVDCHGSQCGFCTPGFVMSLYASYIDEATLSDDAIGAKAAPAATVAEVPGQAQASGKTEARAALNDRLAGNLCRCTGYGPILDAGLKMADYDAPDWDDARRRRELKALQEMALQGSASQGLAAQEMASQGGASQEAASQNAAAQETLALHHGTQSFYAPATLPELAALIMAKPDAIILAGASDVSLWITKQHRVLKSIIYIGRVRELRELAVVDNVMSIGAGVNYTDAAAAITAAFPDFGELLRRIGAMQVRNVGTIGGNIANGSPIGDTPPALIALGAQLVLRRGDQQRRLALEDFFIAYGRQDIAVGEFVERIEIPLSDDGARLRCYKIAKRFDQDISALCGCFNIEVQDGVVTAARICFGGMAGTPARARHVEAALIGQSWTMQNVEAASAVFDQDYTPLSDMRASAQYRLQVTKNLLVKYFLETSAVHLPNVAMGADTKAVTTDADISAASGACLSPQLTRLVGPGAAKGALV